MANDKNSDILTNLPIQTLFTGLVITSWHAKIKVTTAPPPPRISGFIGCLFNVFILRFSISWTTVKRLLGFMGRGVFLCVSHVQTNLGPLQPADLIKRRMVRTEWTADCCHTSCVEVKNEEGCICTVPICLRRVMVVICTRKLLTQGYTYYGARTDSEYIKLHTLRVFCDELCCCP
jgi:hypothetical protein